MRSNDPVRVQAAAERFRILPAFADLKAERLVALRESIRRKHALAVIAAELGFESWIALKAALAPVAAPRLDRIFDGGGGAYLNHWCKTYEEAAKRAPFPAGTTECIGCGQVIADRFCSRCGELRPDERDHSLRHFLAHAVEAFTQIDGKLGRTLLTLLSRPGRLTAEYMRGRRNSYVAPLQLFLIANVVFFFMNAIARFNTFTTPLFVHLYRTPYSELARSIAIPRLAERGIPLADYALQFDSAAGLHAKTLVILMVPILSVFVMAAYWRARRFYVQHLVFSLHFYAFMLLLMSVTNAITVFLLRAAARFGTRSSDSATDGYVTTVLLALIGTYLFLALRTVYAERRWVAIGKALALTAAVAVTLQLYRFILFFVTLYST